MERRKLFSSTPSVITRRKLFSETVLKSVQCMDCGYTMDTAASTTHLLCPKCGGDRFNVLNCPVSPVNTPEPVIIEEDKKEIKEEKSFSRKSLFGNDEIQKEFSEPSNDFEKLLKEYSGKTFSDSELNEEITNELVEKGFACITDEGIKVSDTAFMESKLFSKLIVSVTKILDLDPVVSMEPKESVIESLASHKSITPKCIMLLRKAHNLPPKEVIMSDSTQDYNDSSVEVWAKDSGICNDLRLEFGDSDMSVKEFTKLLDERYPDAPEGIIDHLISTGVINIQGNQVSIFK